MTNIGRNERRYRTAKASLYDASFRMDAECPLWMFNPRCPRNFDWSLPHTDPYAFCVDHIIPRSKGGDPDDITNMQPAHRLCNEMRGDADMPTLSIVDKHSEEWPT